jgi:predicted DCC family thiol-disulfide oxidoreductase YuxK
MKNKMTKSLQFPLTIYYDASCPLCASEMHTIKETDFEDKLILVDCSSQAFNEPESCPSTKEAMMERIHAQDAAGNWIKGADVFSAAYEAGGFNNLAKVWGSKTLRPILKCAYPFVADNRHWLSKTPLPYLLNCILRLWAPSR